MEQLNRIELRGNVGSVRKQEVNGKTITRFALATNYVYKDKEGCAVIETTWHNVSYWGNTELEKGDKVEVVGRLKNTRYNDKDGNERYETIVNAYEVTKLDCGLMNYEMKKMKNCSFDVYFNPIVNVKYEVEDENNLTAKEREEIIDTAIEKAKSDFDGYLNLFENVEKIEVYEVDGVAVK